MVSFVHGKNTKVLFANPTVNACYDLSPYFNDVSLTNAIEATEVTTFNTAGVKSYIPGLRDGSITMSGFYDGTTSGLDAIFAAALSNTVDEAVVVFPQGGATQNERCYMAQGIQTKYDLKSPVAGVVAADAEIQADKGVWSGRGQLFTTSGNGSTNSFDGLGSTTNGGLVVIGVLSLTGTLSITLQHSQDGSTWVNATSALTTVGTEIVNTAALPTTLYRYTRLNWTLSGANASANIYFGFARF
jgi:hypothetical protein